MMYSILIAVVLVASVSAKAQIPVNLAGYGEIREDKPQPCCAPSAYTGNAGITFIYVSDGELSEEFLSSSFAYDAIEKKTASKTHISFSNGTEESLTSIDEYRKGVSYLIYRGEHGEECYKSELHGHFLYNCIPDNAVYVGSASVGDRVLEVNTWYIEDSTSLLESATIVSVQKDECVPVRSSNRVFDPETGVQYHTASIGIINFRLGICDEDQIFHVPDICEEAQDVAKMTGRLLKFHQLGLTSPSFMYGAK